MKYFFTIAVWCGLGLSIQAQHTVVNPGGTNNGTLHPTTGPGLVFGGTWSGEGIASDRIFGPTGDNWNGLDFYTNAKNRMMITSGGRIGIGAKPANSLLHINALRPSNNTTEGIYCETSALDNAYGAYLKTGVTGETKVKATGVYAEITDQPSGATGAINNYGVETKVYAGSTAKFNYGVYGFADLANNGNADGVTSANYSIYGKQGDHLGSWAGYFEGRVDITTNLNVQNDATIQNNLTINGSAWVNGSTIVTSDQRLKENINKLKEANELLNKINVYSYSFKKTEYPQLKLPTGLRYGVLAQEVQKEFPELVGQRNVPKVLDKEGNVISEAFEIMGVNYIEFIPILIQAHKDQQSEIEELKQTVEELKDQLTQGNSIDPVNRAYGESNEKAQGPEHVTGHLLSNSPNPFSEKTTISYEVSAKANQAQIKIFDMQGVNRHTYEVVPNDHGQLEINSSDFDPGMYMYLLIVNGQEVDSKVMMIVK